MLRVLGGSCNDADTCPRVLEEPDVSDDVFVEGYDDVDPKVVAEASPPPGWRLVRVPRRILIDAGRRLERQALFASVTDSAFRLETLPQYLVAQEDERFRAFRESRPLPARSAKTKPMVAADRPEHRGWAALAAHPRRRPAAHRVSDV
jgi:Family of unknown function (DUF6879)